jgi:hypothetical protein
MGDTAMKRVVIIDQLYQTKNPEALVTLAAQMAKYAFTGEDLQHTIDAIVAQDAQAVLLEVDKGPDAGAQYWIIEKPHAMPPLNWTLAEWQSRLHSKPCGACHHHSEDRVACDCACHDIFRVILNFDE